MITPSSQSPASQRPASQSPASQLPASQSPASAVDDPSKLLARRAHLLEQRRGGQLGPEDNRELTDLTEKLALALEKREPSIRRLTIDEDGAALRRLVKKEPVHPLENPEDIEEIRRRVEGDRFCFILENAALPGVALNVVWIALCADLPGGMSELLAADRQRIDPHDARVAVFYSIWSAEAGLAGIPGGSRLLDMVTKEMQSRYPSIEIYTTLSPIPGLRSAVETAGENNGIAGDATRTEAELLSVAARYLCTTDERGRPTDSVARFHMRNGARMWRLLPGADTSTRGEERSWGLMVNYRYAPEDLEENAAKFARGELVVDPEIAALATRG